MPPVKPDELFGGYPWYHDENILYQGGFPWARSTAERGELLRPEILRGIGVPAEAYVASACEETIAKTEYLDSDDRKARRMREMFMLNFYWFMQVLLDRKDRMSMASGLEVRVPFCDHRIAEYAYNIPWEIKSANGREKGLLRYAMRGVLPDSIINRKKSPYPKTHNPAYLKAVMALFENLLRSPDCRVTQIFDADKLHLLLETEGRSFRENWFGQLMQGPQIFAYLIQTEFWLRESGAEILL